MKSFAELSKPGQVRRLRQLAETALSHYALPLVKLSPLTHFDNTTFRVVTEDGWQGVLRVCRHAKRTLPQIQSELVWLHAIRQETSLVVPTPVANQKGEWITTEIAPGISEPRHCVLFEWVEGRFRTKGLSPMSMKQVGAYMGQLHCQAQQFIRPIGFERLRLQLDGEIGVYLAKGLRDGSAIITPEDRRILEQTERVCAGIIAQLGEATDVFNLIHADMHQRNYLFHPNGLRLIDFDDCGFGHFLYDLGVTCWYLRRRTDYVQLRQALLQGYRQHHFLSADHEQLLNHFVALRSLLMASVMVVFADQPQIRANSGRFIAGICHELRLFLNH